MGVPNHSVAVDLLEGHLASKFETKHDHPSHPEEQDIPASLQERGWEETIKIGRLKVMLGMEGNLAEEDPPCLASP